MVSETKARSFFARRSSMTLWMKWDARERSWWCYRTEGSRSISTQIWPSSICITQRSSISRWSTWRWMKKLDTWFKRRSDGDIITPKISVSWNLTISSECLELSTETRPKSLTQMLSNTKQELCLKPKREPRDRNWTDLIPNQALLVCTPRVRKLVSQRDHSLERAVLMAQLREVTKKKRMKIWWLWLLRPLRMIQSWWPLLHCLRRFKRISKLQESRKFTPKKSNNVFKRTKKLKKRLTASKESNQTSQSIQLHSEI